MKRLFSVLLLCLFGLLNVLLFANDTISAMHLEAPHFSDTEYFLEGVELEKCYRTDNIMLMFTYEVNEKTFTLEYEAFGATISNVHVNDSKHQIYMDVRLQSEEVHVEVQLIMEDMLVTKTIYFVEHDSKYYCSAVSMDQAKTTLYQALLQQGLITTKEYEAKKQALWSVGVQQEQSRASVRRAAYSNLITIGGTFTWIDDNQILPTSAHPLRYTKIELYARSYIEGSLEDSYLDVLLETQYTDENGAVQFYVDSSEVPAFGYLLKINAAGINTKVVDADGLEYYYMTELDFPTSSSDMLLFDRTFTMESDFGKALQLSQSSIYGARYAKYLNGGIDITACTIHYVPGTGAYYTSNHIYINQRTGSTTRPHSYADWDVMSHEYSHHIQRFFGNISANPGGQHYINTNNCDDKYNSGYTPESAKRQGLRLAWAEGWATYNGTILQQHFTTELANIPYVNDDRYTSSNGVDYSLLDYSYRAGSLPTGEGNECAVSQILYKMADSRRDDYDIFQYGDWKIWELVRDNKPVILSHFIQACYADAMSKSDLGRFLAKFRVASNDLEISAGNTAEVPPTFIWNANGGSVYFNNDLFDLIFEARNGVEIFRVEGLTSTTYTLTLGQWNQLTATAGCSYSVYISSKASTYEVTGPYYSESLLFDNPGVYEGRYLVSTADYGFEQQYFFETKTKEITVPGFSFNTTRLRAGYIEKEYIVLSAKRSGAGTAFLEYAFDTPIYQIDVVLALWSSTEQLSASTGEARIEYLDEHGNWVVALDLLNDVALSTDRKNPDTYSISFGNGTTAFRFYTTVKAATGSSNKGRLCIGDMILYTEKND